MKVLQMDAAAMTFADSSFDVVHARSVFHHLPDPEQAAREIARILRPAGAAYISLHLYSSDTGSLDPRNMGTERTLPPWAHLRTSTKDSVLQNAFLNELRLSEWRELFADSMPGSRVEGQPSANAVALSDDAARLMSEGELTGFTLEELLTGTVVVTWRKP